MRIPKSSNIALFSIMVLVLIAIMGAISPDINTSTLNQVTPPSDPNALKFESWSSSSLQTVEFIFDDSGTITYERQAANGTVLENRIATIEEEDQYLHSIDISTATQWVTDRTAELEQCEDDMLALDVALDIADWDSRSSNFRSQSIQGIALCQEVNSRVNRITINKLLEQLINGGIIE